MSFIRSEGRRALGAATPLGPSSVDATILFAERTAEPPFVYPDEPPPGAPPSNAAYGPQRVTIANARAIFDDASLDREGFALIRHRSAVHDHWDEAQTLALGHPEAARIVQDLTGAARVVVYDHTRRRVEPRGASGGIGGGAGRGPATRAHVDQTIASGVKRVRELMGEDAEALLRRRIAIINLWRPIRHAAQDWPLAVCDARTVAPEDLVTTKVIYPQRAGELYYLAHNPAQRWFCVPDLQPDEALLFKCWGSDAAMARSTPHASFENPEAPANVPPRESIEFRTMAFF